MEVYEFPVGVVVLDIDAPTRHFWDGEMGAKAMETDVRYGLATALSERWQLGRFWMYRTKSGLHVVFERVLVQRSDVRDVMADANAQVGWKLCGGFFCMHADKDRLTTAPMTSGPWTRSVMMPRGSSGNTTRLFCEEVYRDRWN